MDESALRRSLLLAIGLWGASASAQPMGPVVLPSSARVAEVPSTPGEGADVTAVRAFFGGFPTSLVDARDLIVGRSTAPAFDLWCGNVPYVDFTNGAVLDSAGRESPTVLCLPFLDPNRQMPPHTCAPVNGVPGGRYYQNGGMAVRFEGQLAFRAAGDYTLAWGHDDGVGFRFGEVVVYEFPDPTGSRVDRQVVRVPEAGLYPFTLDWYDTYGAALIDWYIATGDATTGDFDTTRFRLVPREDIYSSESAPCTSRCERCEGATPVCDRGAHGCVQCVSDVQCGSCTVCRDRRCVEVPGLRVSDGGPLCAPDASEHDSGTPDASERDSASPDASPPMVDGSAPDAPPLDVATIVARPAGCSCCATSVLWHSRGVTSLALALFVVARRRRRS